MSAFLTIIPDTLLNDYNQKVDERLDSRFDGLKDAEISTDTFSFYTSVSAIASSRIEGEQMEIDSYLKHKMLNTQYQPDLLQKPNDLYNAYLYAQANPLTEENFLNSYKLITAHLLPAHGQGKLRTGNMVVMEHNTGRIQFEAAPAGIVKQEYEKLWKNVDQLKTLPLSTTEVFYYASFIHLVFVSIHPFDDGNGRAARLLEKWFIAQILGSKAWYLKSELNYYNNIDSYYKNLNRLGIFYEQLDYANAIPFLLMLPDALKV